MNYFEPLSNQLLVFIRAVGFGVMLGIFYDFFELVKALLPKKTFITVICDVIFSLAGTLSSFFFMIVCNSGIVRFNLIIAQLLGGVAFHMTAGRYIIMLIKGKKKKIFSENKNISEIDLKK